MHVGCCGRSLASLWRTDRALSIYRLIYRLQLTRYVRMYDMIGSTVNAHTKAHDWCCHAASNVIVTQPVKSVQPHFNAPSGTLLPTLQFRQVRSSLSEEAKRRQHIHSLPAVSTAATTATGCSQYISACCYRSREQSFTVRVLSSSWRWSHTIIWTDWKLLIRLTTAFMVKVKLSHTR